MDDAECPYCHEDVEICHDDGHGCEDGEKYQQECPHCDKVFVFIPCISYSYDTYQADCLNGAAHVFRATWTHPIGRTMMECMMCEERRIPTDVEMATILAERKERDERRQISNRHD